LGASAIEFRLRMVINTIIVVLGFWVPWIDAWGIGSRVSLLEWTALELSRLGLLPFHLATPIVIVLATLLAAVGAVFRIWGSAYLGPAAVIHPDMNAQALVAGGPYRYVRNPLYLGLWFMVAALAFLMPVTGALFAMVFLTLFLARLILGEETFLRAQLGESYQAYLQAVPRLIPRLRSSLASSSQGARWLQAIFSELTPIGVLFTLSVLSWSYDSRLMMRAILIAFGASLVVRALMPGLTREKGLES
jgi:protein-S-isoprenylcysteine O-methyltransferase Ste14